MRYDQVLNLFFLHRLLHECAMPSLIATSSAGCPFKKTGAKFIQNRAVVFSQHAAGGLIDCYNLALLVEKQDTLFQVIQKLF